MMIDARRYTSGRIAVANLSFMGVGNRPQLAVELASANFKLRDTPRSRSLLARALREAAVDSTSSLASSSPMVACISTKERSYSKTSEVE